MINHQVVPHLYNLTTLKPLIKDLKKSTDDITNLRPEAVSDSLANLFEEIMLKEVSKYHRDHEIQFGFKAHMAYLHFSKLLKTLCTSVNGKNRLQLLALQKIKLTETSYGKNLLQLGLIIRRKKLPEKSSLSKLTTLGIITPQMHPKLKAHLYKTYVRPVLKYGLENMTLNPRLINDIKRG
ncbi:unnamed protein product [Brachionus calyciflorus]|uniref:Uncharacterized protein n=1 Tax=Brachionus calyciflorus TaxID=104777 RepID=A0A813NH12_9BILA|nr:unnamed protein product [Brachionus calyciflorus]